MSRGTGSAAESPIEAARRAREAQRSLGSVDGKDRSRLLRGLASILEERRAELLEANRRDLEAAAAEAVPDPLVQRLSLSPGKLETLAKGVLQLAGMPDPVGRVLSRTLLDHRLELRKVTSPLGVLLVIFESRPDAVVQIGSLALRAGNAVLLKGGSEARHSNRALVDCLREALSAAGLPRDSVVGIEGREAVSRLLDCDREIDLVIPRGSGALVRSIQESTRIPVLGHAEGICHVYLDRAADLAKAERIVVDAKCDYPAACNAAETLLVHRDLLQQLGPLAEALRRRGVELRADEAVQAAVSGCRPAEPADWDTEHGALVLGVRAVADLDEAIRHIHEHGSGHTEAIVTEDRSAADRFLREIDSASVFWNASTRFADGFRYGLGAEVGISTSRIHARGPVGVDGLLTTRWLLAGDGQAAGDYGPGGRSFLHRSLDPSDPG